MEIKTNENLKNYCTFKIGGNADFIVFPSSASEIAEAVASADRYIALGAGSNVLFSDAGFRGTVIQLKKNFNKIRQIGETQIKAEAGATLADLADFALRASLTGAEFTSGIPGCVGGAVFMNAGAYDGEIKNICEEVTALNTSSLETVTLTELEFGYRESIIQKLGWIVLDATFKLQKGSRGEISAKQNDFNARRREKQPLEFPSAGSTFKRPKGYFAGKLIMDAGLAGAAVGGARVSEKHCGFVINAGGASAKDVTDLIEYIIRTVYDKYNVILTPEIKTLGE
jgi:UDP-N-acetylmuramate dehydrogenase